MRGLKMLSAAAALTLPGLARPALAAAPVQVRVTIENLAPANGVALSPFFIAAHDGTFDAFDAGAAASSAIQNIAELANTAPQTAAFDAAHPTGVAATLTASTNAFGPGIFLPGGSGSMVLTLDPAMHRYFSFGAMVVPSNDFFVGNDASMGIPLFDAAGHFVAPTVTLTGAQIWDAGSEVNGPFGAAFLVGQDINGHTAQNGLIAAGADFAPYTGLQTPAGYVFTDLPGANAPIARISFAVVPEPASLSLLGIVPLFLLRRRR